MNRAFGLAGVVMAWGLAVGAGTATAGEWKSEGVAADVAPPLPLEAPVAAAAAAAQVDRLLTEELPAKVAKRTGDETFLRRISLDLIGELPTPEAMTAFALDNAADKRARAIDRLLADPLYGQNWARYWRDVMLYRRGDERALLSSMAAVAWLTEQFNANTPWNEMARELVTARGNIFEEGDTVLIASQWGQVPETAAEVSRVLLGVQIQCAQCHDHPTDRWKREQFHELAAFFPRFVIRRSYGDDPKRTFELASLDKPANKAPKPGKAKGPPDREYYMPDLENPSAKGTLITPTFFINGQSVETGTSDQDRRGAVANWITAPENPWFAKALVNRLWGELVGEGFYEPIDDLGPDRECSAPKSLDYLAAQLVAHEFDVKWLLSAITSTEAYQRESRTRRNPDQTPFVANCPQRLRADQLFNALTSALEIKEQAQRPQKPGNATPGGRGEMVELFGYDPSDPRDEVTGAIDQALLLMNSPKLAGAIAGRNSRTLLGRLLADSDDNEMIVVDLYLRCLAREPSDQELQTCLMYVKKVNNRAEAFEDVLWALLNSTEFLYRN